MCRQYFSFSIDDAIDRLWAKLGLWKRLGFLPAIALVFEPGVNIAFAPSYTALGVHDLSRKLPLTAQLIDTLAAHAIAFESLKLAEAEDAHEPEASRARL